MSKEKILIILISILTIVIVNLPFAYFYAKNTPGYTFLGRKVVNSEDTYTYLSFIEQAKQGRFLFENLYTSEPQKPTLFRPSYLVIGKLASVFRLSAIASYHLSRIVLSIIFFLVLYKLLEKFFDKPYERVLAYFVVLFANGLGTINWIPEAVTFLSLGEAPHFILSQVLAITGIYFVFEFFEKENYKYMVYSSLAFLFLSFEHPFDIVLIAPVIFVTSLLKRNSIFKSSLLAGLSSFGLAYQYLELSNNPILKLWQAQNTLSTPSLTIILLGYGFLIPLAIIGVEKFITKVDFKYKFVIVWVFTAAVVIYLPFNFQRRLLETVHIPISILATVGLLWIADRLGKYKTDVIFLSLIILPIFSLYSIVNDFKTIPDTTNGYYYYIDNNELEAIEWLKPRSTFADIIFANKDYGNIIPGLIARKVFLGHNIQTVDLPKKIQEANTILLLKNEAAEKKFFKDNNIKYIFLGKNDAVRNFGFTPEDFGFLKEIYNKDGVTIYQILE